MRLRWLSGTLLEGFKMPLIVPKAVSSYALEIDNELGGDADFRQDIAKANALNKKTTQRILSSNGRIEPGEVQTL